MAAPIAITDIETTGLDPTIHEIIEIGLLVVDQCSLRIIDKLEIKIRPEHIEKASQSALDLNGYSNFDWRDSITLKEAMELYSRKTESAIFCAHNMTFDWSFISEAYRKTGIENKLDHHRLDLYTMAWIILRNSDTERLNLKAITMLLGIEEEPVPHRALNGASTAYEILIKLIALKHNYRSKSDIVKL